MKEHESDKRSPPLPAKQTPDVTMKKAYMTTTIAAVAGVAVVCSSCAYPNVGYSSYTVPGTVSAGVAWSNASYDASGFPIFGYSYGRPVYGYTSAGEAVFTIAALTALCFVPYWGPGASSAALPCRSRTGSTAATWHCSTAGTAPLHTVPQAAWTSAHFHDAHARGQWREDLAPAHFRAPSRQSNHSPERLDSLSKTLRSPCLTHHGRASASKRRSEEQRRLHHANAGSCGRLKLK